MLALHFRRYWIAANVLLITTVTSLTIVPAIFAPTPLTDVPGIDKWLHAVTFAVLALWFTGQYARPSYWKIAAGLIAYGAAIEIGQSLIPYRTAEWGDLAADAAGVLVGVVIALVFTGGWSMKVEAWYVDRFGRPVRNQ